MRPRIDWLTEVRLGEMPDANLAAILGVSENRVAVARQIMGIRKFDDLRKHNSGRCAPSRPYDADPDLGKVPDRVIAARYGVSVVAVQQRRSKLGVPACRKHMPSAIHDDPDLGRLTDADLARRHGVSRERVRQIRAEMGKAKAKWNRSAPAIERIVNDPDLGKIADAKIARRHGVCVATVKTARGINGIPRPSLKTSPLWTDDRLGTVVDRVIAEEYGVDVCRVTQVRLARGIPACCPKNGPRVKP